MNSSPVWDGTESSFNKLFRKARLSGAVSLNLKKARCRLDEIVSQGETDPEKFWQYVFTEEPVKVAEPDRFVNANAKHVDRGDALEASRARHRIAAAAGFRPKPARCEVCNTFARIVLDHDHKTEKLRGWICDRCNQILGMVKDDPNLLEGLAKYLRKSFNDFSNT